MLSRVLFLLLLTGCPWVGERVYDEQIRDADGDGAVAERFGGPDCRDQDPEITDCDADGDGVRTVAAGGTDCDDGDATIHPDADERCNGVDDDCDGLIDDDDDGLIDAPRWYADDDDDGYGDPAEERSACVTPAGWVDDDRDCDDDRADIHPGAPEFCDADDRNCDGDPIADAVDPSGWFGDGDGDGFGSGEQVALACTGPADTAPAGGDCDDTDPQVFPGAAEVWYDGIDQDCEGGDDFDADGDGERRIPEGPDCDDTTADVSTAGVEVCDGGVDNDCDGLTDVDDPDLDPSQLWTWYPDNDGDTFGDDTGAVQLCPGGAPTGFVLLGGDCDDTRATRTPGATETCDGLDNNCNGLVDENAIDQLEYHQDADGDGYGDLPLLACTLGPGLSAFDGDCNDADPAMYPGAPEVCGDLVRQDCTTISVFDCDADGYDDVGSGGDDCDDTRDDVHPGATEVCDAVDNDCDDLLDGADPDADLSTITPWYADVDGDGWGDALSAPASCSPPPGTVPSSRVGDCDDQDALSYPGAPETCDGVDNDCDGAVDTGDVVDAPVWAWDGDGDGHGHPALVQATTCGPPDAGPWVLLTDDCDDGDPLVSPSGVETCNGVDDDCDGLTDGSDPSVTAPAWYRDTDGDGWGVATDVLVQCAAPAGYASQAGDCFDTDAAIHPDAPEVCNGGKDDDCDGFADDADPELQGTLAWYADADADGFGDAADVVIQCAQPVGRVANGLDCDDGATSVYPGALEVCDGIDNDCDLLVDDADTGVIGALQWYADDDFDGYGDDLDLVVSCAAVPGRVLQGGDCDGLDPLIHPNAPEACNALDDDCDGLIDDADADVVGLPWFRDADGDTFGDPALPASPPSCAQPAGHVGNDDDCDDSTPLVNEPILVYVDGDGDGVGGEAVEACTPPPGTVAVGGDCDDGDSSVTAGGPWYIDGDGDGYGAGGPMPGCTAPPGHVAIAFDCDDFDAAVSPAAVEACDDLDNDCDNAIDESGPSLIGGQLWYPDLDGDGHGDPTLPVNACAQPLGHVAAPTDCDDSLPALYVGQTLVVAPAGGDYTSLATAVTEACSPAEILASGKFDEQVTILDKEIAIEPLFPGARYKVTPPAGGPAFIVDGSLPGTRIEGASASFLVTTGNPAIEVRNGADVTLVDLDLSYDNSTGNGGALRVTDSTVWLEGSTLTWNTAPRGGAIYASNSDLFVVDTVLADNRATVFQGGAIHAVSSDVWLVESTFDDNTTDIGNGGALYASGGTVTSLETDYLSNSEAGGLSSAIAQISDADVLFEGGLMIANGSGLTIDAATVRPATLVGVDLRSTGDTAISLQGSVAGTLSNVIVAGSSVAGLSLTSSSTATVDNSSIVGNVGVGVFTSGTAGVLLRSSLSYGNGQDHSNAFGGTITAEYSRFGAMSPPGFGNSSGDPVLLGYSSGTVVDPALWLLQHDPTGPLVDAGAPGFLDLDGSPADIGAYGGPAADRSFYDDTDADGLYDGWELHWYGDLSADAASDTDGDGVPSSVELANKTDPTRTDTDADGCLDNADTTPLVGGGC